MDAYLQPLVSCHLYMAIIREKKKDFGEIEENQKIIIKKNFMLELHISLLFIYVCVDYICISLCVCVCVCV